MSKQGNEHQSPEAALAAILGSDAPTAAPTPAATTDDLASDDLSSDGAEATLEVVDDFESEGQQPPRRARRSRGAPKPASPGGRLARTFGLLCLCGGITATVLQAQGRYPQVLQHWGLGDAVLLAVGAVAYVLGAVRRQVGLAQVRMDTLTFQQQEAQLDMQANISWLVEQQQQHAEKPPAEGEELDRVLDVLQRHDEKVNNLSRALKMYGKPLMEIANQGADVAAQVNQLKGHVEALLGALQQGFTRIESAARTQEIDLGPLEQKTVQTADELRRALSGLADRLPSSASMQQLQQQLVRVEASVQAMSQRVDDSDVRKSLVRLEDTSKVHGKKLDEVARQDAVQQEVQRLERQLDTSLQKVNNAVEQVRSKNLGGLENSVRDMQRELSGLATSVAYIQQAIKSGSRTAAAGAPAAAPIASAGPLSPTPAAASRAPQAPVPPSTPTSESEPRHTAAAAATTAPAATPAPNAAPAGPADGSGLNDAQAGVAQNRTGPRATSGKNVLGAIAKLKQMKN